MTSGSSISQHILEHEILGITVSGVDPGVVQSLVDEYLGELGMGVPLIMLVDEDGDYTYVGEAEVGTLTSESSWRIYRLDESLSGDEELIKLYASGSIDFDQVWDDRTELIYS